MSNVDHLIAKLSPEHQAEMRKMVALAHPKEQRNLPSRKSVLMALMILYVIAGTAIIFAKVGGADVPDLVVAASFLSYTVLLIGGSSL